MGMVRYNQNINGMRSVSKHSRSILICNACLFSVTTVFLFLQIRKDAGRTDEYVYKYSNLCASDVASQAAHAKKKVCITVNQACKIKNLEE